MAFTFLSATAHAETWVITDQAHPVSVPTGVRIIRLDDQQRLEELLSQQLPNDQRQAEATIQRYLATPAGKRLQSDLVQAQQGITDAWSVGVEKIPAVVIDRRYVVYGEADVAKAIAQIDRARSLSR
ncbi:MULTISPECIES: TIGR03757 family integrating conjugative element protein [Pseudomonas]|jgi:integrating conjugative element protein (TIGR03757 family)|uniref:TIGR03757 family integrating conjugative element protein n=1 Tax=Pseudomonas TaxID=286 RepID=UPI000B81DA20|nr:MULTISPECIES: TIGR03757 family integrating conjugative element protein [unclassified Pseudomonas]MDP9058189.1 TIGR03757 family integrating conjugative element protein [Pseudomonadota bacterium]MDP9218597.1 TIGR03757 family integrating conjugative element protein [Pseudomonadota bacterium]MDP9445568.1 TIGR03757 family integrating conjugative element protein [Pseudomonadota bacterium]MDQ3594614.1 TIGR03757 family integrating conjugative element protein [Pseudomonadota bacterium]WLI52068.1 TIG